MSKIIDRRKIAMGGHSKRSLSLIRNIAVHYSATTSGNTTAFERHWKGNRGWSTGGYHEVILTNGDVELNYDPDTISNGVGGHNSKIYNICYVGDAKPNKEQLSALINRVKYNMSRFNLKASDVKGHREFPKQATACPNLDMDEFRQSLEGAGTNTSKPDKMSTTKSSLAVDGKWGKATTRELQKSLDTVKDGIISNQLRNNVSESLYGNTVQFGQGGSMVIRALQRKIGAKADGYLGPETVRKLQEYLGTVVDGKFSRPSLAVKELQKRLNSGSL